jgi:adenylate kinase
MISYLKKCINRTSESLYKFKIRSRIEEPFLKMQFLFFTIRKKHGSCIMASFSRDPNYFMSSLATTSSSTIETKPLMVILMGPPGAGKGTHAGPLSEYLHLPHVSTGDLFREHIRNKTPLGLKAREFMDKGNLVPDELVLDMLFDRIGRDDCKNGVILDGFPRTVAQAEALDRRLGPCQLVALHFSLADDLLVERIVGRIVCKGCGRPYHIKFDPPKKPGLCDHCNGVLYQRDDDREEVVRRRLHVYYRETHPVIEFYARKKDSFHQIESEGTKESIFQEALKPFTS